MYNQLSTDFDVMKEFLICGADLTEQGFPILNPVSLIPQKSIDFSESGKRTLKKVKDTNINFYIADCKFTAIWNNPDRYLERLKCFHSVCSPDFTIDTQMPLVMQKWNKYRNMALSHYYYINGITVIPSVNVMPFKGREWLLDGIPTHSTLACCTNGRIKSKKSRLEFCQGFYEMCDRLMPNRVIIVGRIPQELNTNVEILNFDSRNQRISKELKNGDNNRVLQEKEETN